MMTFKATPLEKFSSLHKISVLNLLGLKSNCSSPSFSWVLNSNLYLPIIQNDQAQMTFHFRDSKLNPVAEQCDFSITNLTRWRLDLSHYDTFMHFLQKMNRKHYARYNETKEIFHRYGAKISLIEDDWSQYAETAYKLYMKVAEKHGSQLYDLNFFKAISTNRVYKLMCALHDQKLIGALIIVDEEPVLHSMVCGLDYDHSTRCHAYAQMHYEFIRYGIDLKKYKLADVGITANDAKSNLDFQPISVCLDVYAHNRLVRAFLRFISMFVSATINSKARLEMHFHLPRWKKYS